ncbi:MAG: cyclic pyranopterin monophosphate synthase MoaC, partial [Pseudomonadota bacterium]
MGNSPKNLTHLDQTGAARMVDVGAKPHTARTAIARG